MHTYIYISIHVYMYAYVYIYIYVLYKCICMHTPVVPHKAVAEVSKIAIYRRLVAVNHGSQSEPTNGPKSGWRQRNVVVVVVVIVFAM